VLIDPLFTLGKIGTLEIPNRIMRSATAERMADETGRPREQFYDFYRELAAGGVGLICAGLSAILVLLQPQSFAKDRA